MNLFQKIRQRLAGQDDNHLKTLKEIMSTKLTSIYSANFRQELEQSALRMENICKDRKNFTNEAVADAERELEILNKIKREYV